MKIKSILYSGDGCHLCDIAYDLIKTHTPELVLELDKKSITGDHDLMHLYGARIPVLKRCDSQQELEWPFTEDDLKEFLQ